jgi:hypothetical protein
MCRLFFCVNPGGENNAFLRKFLRNANKTGNDAHDAVDGIGFAIKLSGRNLKHWTTLRTLAHNPAEYCKDTNDTMEFVAESKPQAILSHIRIYVHSSNDRMPRTFPFFNNIGALQPICFEQFTMALKGQIIEFPNPSTRARIRARIAPKYAARLTGLTDAELVFYLILTHLCRKIPAFSAQKQFGPTRIATSIRAAIRDILAARADIAATIMFSTQNYVAVVVHGTGSKLFVYTAKRFAASNYAISPEFERVDPDTVIVASLQSGAVVHTDAVGVNERF